VNIFSFAKPSLPSNVPSYLKAGLPNAKQKILDKKMLAVVAGASTFETKEILFALIQQFVAARQQDDSALENTFAVLKNWGWIRSSGKSLVLNWVTSLKLQRWKTCC
jgi:hypothetical protein